MNNDLFMRLRAYKEMVMLARRMLKEGLITKAEFLKIESTDAKIHGFSARSIFREIT